MSSTAQISRRAEERRRTQLNVAAGLAMAAAAERLDEAPSPHDATVVARRVLAERRRALDTAQLRVRQLDNTVVHLSRVMPFLEEGWAEQRDTLKHAISDNAQDGLASWLNYWFAAASFRRADALLRLQSDVALPPAASIVANRMSVATRALADDDWQFCHGVLEIGVDGVQVGPRQVPDCRIPGDRGPDDSVREYLRLLAARLALHNRLPDQADAMLGANSQDQSTAPRLALRARSARLRGAGSEAESLLKQARDLDPRDLDVTVASIAQARQRGELDTALDNARSAVETLLSLSDVDSDIGRLVDAPAELWITIAERAWDEGDRDAAQRFLDHASKTAQWNDDRSEEHTSELQADIAASPVERRRALISAGERRTDIGQMERARRDYEAAASGTPTDGEDAHVQASDQLRGDDVVSEPVKLNETSRAWITLTGLLGLDGGAGLVDPHLGWQGRG